MLKLQDDVSSITDYISNIKKSSALGIKQALNELNSSGVKTIEDLLFLPPRKYEDKSKVLNFSSILNKGNVNTFCHVLSKQILPSSLLKIVVEDLCDGSNVSSKLKRANLMCFGRNYLNKILQIGNTYHIYGSGIRKDEYGSVLQISNFDIKPAKVQDDIFSSSQFGTIKPIFVVSNPKLNEKIINFSAIAIENLDISEYENILDNDYIHNHSLIPLRDAFFLKLFPENTDDIEHSRKTLAAAEVKKYFSFQTTPSVYTPCNFNKEELEFIASQDFEFTESQKRASIEIMSTCNLDKQTERFLQGDVGSGKTIVSFLAGFHEILKGHQVVLMSPTEILSYQHYTNALKAFKNTDVKIGYITSSLKSSQRQKLLDDVRNGDIDFLIGTHAVLNDDFEFKSLSLAIIDEEQRFGALQKDKIREKGECVHILYTTATPIPRSIMKLISGKIDCSVLERISKDRAPVKTLLVSQNRRHEAYRSILPEFQKGHCAYFVVPRINDDKAEKKSIEKLEKELSVLFQGIPYAVIHSKVKDNVKNLIFKDFLGGKIKYLIATSVVEVGMDNPLATVIFIEDADMFGLSTLHQLRGRVGRSNLPSWCFLAYRDEITENGKQRLKILKTTDDGFEIAENDYKLRDGGDLFGVRQSGKSSLEYFDVLKDEDLL